MWRSIGLEATTLRTEQSVENMGDPRILITGATGFIGSRLALHAHRLGLDVVGAGRELSPMETERANELRSAGVPLSIGKLQEPAYARELVTGCTAVIHLAAAQHESQMPDAYFRDVNVFGTRVLLEAARDHGVRRFVYGSSIGVYGSSVDGVLDENSPPRPENIYTQTKLDAESAVRELAQDLETCVIRISETYGPSDYRLLKLFRAIDRGHFVMLGSGTNVRQCLHVNDLVRALLLAVQHPSAVGQTLIIAGAEAMTTNEMVHTIAVALSRRPPRAHVPLWPFNALARVMETALPPLGVQPPLHRRRLDFFSKSFVFSTLKAQSLLGFVPEIDFASGAADTVRWYRARGHLPRRLTHELAGTETV
jgi:dihydroflavonol-4-reductase